MRLRAVRAFGVDPDAVLQVNPVGVMSFTLGLVAINVSLMDGYHSESWTIAYWGIGLGVLSVVWSVIFRKRLGAGWPMIGLAMSMFALVYCRGMETREVRAAVERRIQDDWQRRGLDPLNPPPN